MQLVRTVYLEWASNFCKQRAECFSPLVCHCFNGAWFAAGIIQAEEIN